MQYQFKWLTIFINFQFLVYGGFWIAISLLFIALFVGCNFCRAKDRDDFKQKFRNEGLLLNNKSTTSNPQAISNSNEEGRRDVPVGTIESQWNLVSVVDYIVIQNVQIVKVVFLHNWTNNSQCKLLVPMIYLVIFLVISIKIKYPNWIYASMTIVICYDINLLFNET